MSDYTEVHLNNYYFIVNQLKGYLEGHRGFVAGGVFKNLLNREKVKDIDIFFRNEDEFIDAWVFYDRDCDYELFYENPKVLCYKNINTGIKVELIRHAFGEPAEILDMFDFTVTKMAYVNNFIDEHQWDDFVEKLDYEEDAEDHLEDSYLLVHKNFFEHLHTKRLVIDKNLHYPINTFERMFRYAKYGYFPCKESKMKIIQAINALNTIENSDLSKGLYDGMD